MGCPVGRHGRRIRRFRPSGSAGRLSRGRSGAGGIPWDEGGEGASTAPAPAPVASGRWVYSLGGTPPASSRARRTASSLGPPPWPRVCVTSMNPHSLEGTTMAPTTSLHSFFRALTGRSRRTASHPDAVPEAALHLPRRIDDPASAACVGSGIKLTRFQRNKNDPPSRSRYLAGVYP